MQPKDISQLKNELRKIIQEPSNIIALWQAKNKCSNSTIRLKNTCYQ